MVTRTTECPDSTLMKIETSINFVLKAYDIALQQRQGDEILTLIIDVGSLQLNKYS